MKISLYVDFSDIISAKQTIIDKLNHLIIVDPKHQMYKTQTLGHILQSLKTAGVDGLELIVPKILSDKNIQEINDIVKKYDLPILSIHQANNNLFDISISEMQRLCKIANIFNAQVVTLHSDTLGKNLFNNEFILELKKLQKKHQLVFGIENMPKGPFSLFKTYAYSVNEFSSTINNAGLSMTLDTAHLGQTGEDICEFYENNKEKIVNIHLSDYKKSWLNRILLLANKTHLPLNEGELPISKFLKTLKEENYQGLITMEINGNLDKLCQNAEIIKNAFK